MAMTHRHIEPRRWTLAAIDDTISRGLRMDWNDLRLAADDDRSLYEKILRVCEAKVADPSEQRYHLWKYHAEHALA